MGWEGIRFGHWGGSARIWVALAHDFELSLSWAPSWVSLAERGLLQWTQPFNRVGFMIADKSARHGQSSGLPPKAAPWEGVELVDALLIHRR